MKKIPTIFERDWDGDRSRVVNIINGKCQWVFNGEGIATRKIDGTSVMIRDGKVFKRRELRKNDSAPAGFQIADFDDETGKSVGWVPVGDGPEDRWHRAAMKGNTTDGTYELIGPKIQGNPEHVSEHMLVKHGHGIAGELYGVPRTFDELRGWLVGKDIEGIVFHHPDGRMGKIKLRDFGIKRAS